MLVVQPAMPSWDDASFNILYTVASAETVSFVTLNQATDRIVGLTTLTFVPYSTKHVSYARKKMWLARIRCSSSQIELVGAHPASISIPADDCGVEVRIRLGLGGLTSQTIIRSGCG
jgi:hypothetical protein